MSSGNIFSWLLSGLSFLWGWIGDKYSGFLKSMFEVFSTVFFTFIPFLFLSIKWTKVDGVNTEDGLVNAFYGFWQSGEIVLPILGLCGSVAALLALNVGYFSWWIHAIAGLIVLVFTIGGGAALTGTKGFDQTLNPELITVGFIGYGILAALWFLLAATVRTTEPQPRASDRSARKILDEANSRRRVAGDHQ